MPAPAAERGGDGKAAAPTVLVVDDDAAVCWAVERALAAAGWRGLVAADARDAQRLAAQADAVLTDVRMPGSSGLELLSWLRAQRPQIPVVVMTAYGHLDSAVTAVARGAFDYLAKPLDLDRLQGVLARALGETPLAAAARPQAGFAEDGVIGSSPAMQEVYRRLAAAVVAPVAVLITGPAGSGKELLARVLHRHACGAAAPIVRVPCALLAERAAEELTAALAAARGGSLLLDEVDALSAPAQAALLQALQRDAGCRLLSLARRDLRVLASSAAWNADLAGRLATVHIALPPLAERADDIPALVRALLARCAQQLGRELAITERALAALGAYAWPGNVRELRQVIEEAAVLAVGGVIDCEHLRIDPASQAAPLGFAAAAAQLARRLLDSHPGSVHARAVAELEIALVREALARTGGNQLRAAELLGINRATLKKRMDAAGIA
ncbi:MAG: sigma-54 dependent transcriptional regulator [Planctomycetota bacterium]|nr:sigma-54 dependent transcriptional regulator [Planctomycetota bacterium]